MERPGSQRLWHMPRFGEFIFLRDEQSGTDVYYPARVIDMNWVEGEGFIYTYRWETNDDGSVIEIDEDKKLRSLYDKKLAQEVNGEDVGDEFAGYVFKIMGGQDKQGFSMKQGVLTQDRVRLMMRKGEQGCRGYGMRKGEAYRKSVRGCIISHNISVLHLVIVKKGDDEIPGLTDNQSPRRLGPKRASKLRKLFALTKDDDVRKYVIRRELTGKEKEGKKPPSKAPKIQRLVTPISLQRKRHRLSLKKNQQLKAKAEAAAYEKLVAQRKQEAREKHNEKVSQRRSARSSRASEE